MYMTMKALQIGNTNADIIMQHTIKAQAWRARFLFDSRAIAIGDTEGNLLILDLERGNQESYTIARDHIVAIECIASPNQLLVGTLLQGVYWLNRSEHMIRRLSSLSIHVVHDIAVASLQNRMGIVGDHIALVSLNIDEFDQKIVSAHVPNPSSIVFSPDSVVMAVGGGDETDEKAHLCLYETNNFEPLRVMTFADAICIDRLAFDHKGYLLAAGGYQQCFLLDVRQVFVLCASFRMSSWVTALRFSGDGHWLFIGDDSGKVILYSIETNMIHHGRVEGTVLDVAFGMDRFLYIAYCQDGFPGDNKSSSIVIKKVHLPS